MPSSEDDTNSVKPATVVRLNDDNDTATTSPPSAVPVPSTISTPPALPARSTVPARSSIPVPSIPVSSTIPAPSALPTLAPRIAASSTQSKQQKPAKTTRKRQKPTMTVNAQPPTAQAQAQVQLVTAQGQLTPTPAEPTLAQAQPTPAHAQLDNPSKFKKSIFVNVMPGAKIETRLNRPYFDTKKARTVSSGAPTGSETAQERAKQHAKEDAANVASESGEGPQTPRKNTFKKSGPQDPATPEGEKTPRPIRGLRPSLLPVASSPSRPRKSNTAVQRGPLLTNYHNEPQVEMLSGISSPATRRIIINGSLREYYVVAGPAMSVDPMLNPHGPAYFVQPFVIRNKYVHLQASICILPPYLVNNSVPYTTNPQDITPSMYKYADASNFGLRLQYSASAVPVIQSHLGRTNDVSTLPFYLHRGMPSDDDDGAAWFRYRLLKNKQFGFKMPDSEFWWANDEEVNMYTNGEINGSHPGITLVHNPPHKTPSPYLPAHPQVAYWPIPMPVATYYPGTAPVIERTERVPSPSKRSRTASPDSERDDGRDGSLDSNPFNPAPSADTLARNGGITKDGSGSTITSSRCTSESPSKSHRHGRSPAKSNLSRAKQPKPTSSTGSQDFDFSEYLNLDAMGSSPARSNASFSQHRARQPSADSLGGHSSSGSSYIGTPSNLPLQFPPSVVPAPAVRSASSNSVDSLSQGMDVTGMMNDVFNFDTTDNYMWDKEAEDEHNGFY